MTSRTRSVTSCSQVRKQKRSGCSEAASSTPTSKATAVRCIALLPRWEPKRRNRRTRSPRRRCARVGRELPRPSQAAPWIIRANNRAGDFDDADRARLVIARALVGVQYGEADEVERALSDYAGPKDMPEDEVAQYGPILLARTRLWLGDLDGAREICEQTLDPLAAPNLQQVALTGALAWVACVEGLLTEAEHLAEQALSGAEAVGLAAHPAMVDAVRTRGASGVRARRSRHGRTRTRAVALDERGLPSRPSRS